MRKGKKHQKLKKTTNGLQSPASGVATTATSHALIHEAAINRTRTKLPTKRKLQRQDARKSTAVPPPDEYELDSLDNPMPRQRSRGRRPKEDMKGSKMAPRGKGFTMREEALNTNDNYYSRSWLADKRSVLRYQGITFIESGVLSNKPPTSSSVDSEAGSSHSSLPPAEENVVTVPDETSSRMRKEETGSDPSAGSNSELIMDKDSSMDASLPRADSGTANSISRFHDSESLSDSASSSRKPPFSTPSVPLPPIQFISTEENIVFTPRSQRRQTVQHPRSLSNWEAPVDFKGLTSGTVPDWQKPRKKPKKGGYKQFMKSDGEGEIEYVSPVYGLPMTVTAEDALRDYLENVRAHEPSSESEERYIDMALAERSLGELSLEETRRSRSVETRRPIDRVSVIRQSAFSESASPIRIGSPETPGPVNSVKSHDSEREDGIVTSGDHDEGDVWIEDPQSLSDSGDESGAFDGQDDRNQSNSMRSTGGSDGQTQPSDSDSSDNHEEEEEEDEDPERDENIIANMSLDEYNLDDIVNYPPSSRFARRKSLTRQANVPALPSADEDIATYLQTIWKQDRDRKKEKKSEREKARIQGLLGNKAKSKGKLSKRAARREELEDMVVDMRKINEDIREFWEDDDATDFALPPMHRYARKVVHNLAHAYSLSSKSQGAGERRFTMLFKTMRTAESPIDERKINGILKGTLWMSEQRGGGDRDAVRTSTKVKKHRDGDIVGGDAEEIGSDNRGRVMLEKLGWRSGMGLGAEGMGMKLPVFARVKAGKSGLQ